jgi:hypothetical protein
VNLTSAKVLFKEFIKLGAFFLRESIELTFERRVSSLNQLDCMIPRSGWWQFIELFLVKNVAIILEIRREIFFDRLFSFLLSFLFYCHLLRQSVMGADVQCLRHVNHQKPFTLVDNLFTINRFGFEFIFQFDEVVIEPCVAMSRTMIEVQMFLLPVDRWIVILKPFMSQENILFPETCNSKGDAFFMVVNLHLHFDVFGHDPVRARSTISAIDWDGASDLLRCNISGFDKV